MRIGTILLVLGLLVGGPAAGVADSPVRDRPNILLIVADDLARSDLGYMGSEIRTPNVDELARAGMRLDNFHVAPACSPTRAMLFSGVDSHRAGLGVMGEAIMPEQRGKPGYEGHLNDHVVSLADRLRDAGYATLMVGKWHLGTEPGYRPAERGFDKSFALLQGGASHFSDARGFTSFKLRMDYVEDGQPARLPRDFHSSRFYTDRLIRYIDEARRQRSAGERKPFFAYASYTAPHWPLQVPDDWLDRYAGRYDEGYEALASRRLAAQQAAGLQPPDVTLAPLPPHVLPWASLDARARRRSARTMEIYAAMVENLDHHIGRLIRHLRAIGEYENTLIVFMSDNGPEGNDPAMHADYPVFLRKARIDNSDRNLGREGSFLFYGPGWAAAAAQPYRLYKSFTTEGGTLAPAFVSWPAVIAPGRSSAAFVHVMDVLPTLLDAGHAAPRDPLRYRGRDVLAPEGRSLVPLLRGREERVHPPDFVVGWELFNRRAIRRGDWKAVWHLPPYGLGRWQLFDLASDPYERADLATAHPQEAGVLRNDWGDYVRRNGVVELDYDMDYDK